MNTPAGTFAAQAQLLVQKLTAESLVPFLKILQKKGYYRLQDRQLPLSFSTLALMAGLYAGF